MAHKKSRETHADFYVSNYLDLNDSCVIFTNFYKQSSDETKTDFNMW